MKKKMTSVFVALALVISLCVPATLAQPADYTPQAEVLKNLGLFLGSENGFELDRAASRVEAAVMMVRLLGKEGVAKAENNAHPFTDVPEWAALYVGYLYKSNITKGVSADKFGSADVSTAAQYATYVLRALGYDDSAGDFAWNNSLAKMVDLGIITASESASFSSNSGILRGDVVAISYLSLFAFPKNGSSTLLEKLYSENGAVSAAQLAEVASTDKKIAMLTNILGLPAALPSSAALNSEEIFALSSPATFKIELKARENESGSGSGFFITPDGIAVTSFHVLAYADSASILMPDGNTYPIEGILGVNPEADLALIKIKGSGFPYLTLGDPAKLRTAQRIYCIGSPYGLDNSISDGLVSNANRELDGVSYIQISAPISPGSSGGALMNEYGQVVGVTSGTVGETNVNLAIPITKITTIFKFDEVRSLQYLQVHARFNGGIPYGISNIELELDENQDFQSLKNGDVLAGSIANADDVDCYYVDIDTASAMLVSLTSTVKHSGNLKFEVFEEPSNNVLFRSQHYKGEAFSSAIGAVPAKGRYVIKVYVDNKAEFVSDLRYDLFCFWSELENDESTFSNTIVEFEPNDTPEMANFVPSNGILLGSLSSKADVDYLSLTVYEKGPYAIAVIDAENDVRESLSCEIINAKTNAAVGQFTYNSEFEVSEFVGHLDVGQYFVKIKMRTGSSFDNYFYLVMCIPISN